MEPSFWLDKWLQGQIGFHAAAPNRYLIEHMSELERGAGQEAQGRSVYVPLCGKSMDLHALQRAGFAVVGTELAPLATEAFFREAGLQRATRERDTHREHRAGAFRILEGDIFNIPANAIGPCDAAFDRAALVALPPERREDYVVHLRSVLRPGAVLLLIAFEYDQTQMPGPPFSVDDACVRALWGPHGSVRALGGRELIDEEPRFRERGVQSIRESAYLIRLH